MVTYMSKTNHKPNHTPNNARQAEIFFPSETTQLVYTTARYAPASAAAPASCWARFVPRPEDLLRAMPS